MSWTSYLSVSLVSLRIFRTAIGASSPSVRTTFVRSRRRSSVSAGMGTRMLSPMEIGFSPRSESRMAFSTGPRSEEHTSEIQSIMRISYAVFCLKKKKTRPYSHIPVHHTNYTHRNNTEHTTNKPPSKTRTHHADY